ncbi:MAG: NAD(P)H-hydrate dehydratase [Prevotellaceae bacterium]|jgi:NAD(P)H-hydrate epimerase|nr:NAD(P)H-hydrate dehydratase [Prevotellaceae bacterium]
MKIFTDEQIKEADRYTIENEPVSSIDLMERAALAIAEQIIENVDRRTPLIFVVGCGNNGGDGLATARILSLKNYNCSVFLLYDESRMSNECLINFKRLPDNVKIIDNLDNTDKKAVIVDTISGAGFYGDVREPAKSLIAKINSLKNKVISIDLPSGMKTGYGNSEQTVIKANMTLALEFPKLATLLPEAGNAVGKMKIIHIGLSCQYKNQNESKYHYVDKTLINRLLKKRDKFSYKNIYGHALLICGSRNMTGAAILAAKACLRSGCGLLTVHVSASERSALQISCPSAILSLDSADMFSQIPENIEKYSAAGIGCGTGTQPETATAFAQLLKSVNIPLVIDADAINLLAANKSLMNLIPKNSILTPHLGELKRLVGNWNNEEDKHRKVTELSAQLASVIVLKGMYTSIHLPDGRIYFNSTGNSGMAKGGSGDILTGLITGLMARGYGSFESALLGVYFHGLAGDRAKNEYGIESMNSMDIVNNLFCNRASNYDC